MTVSVHLTTAGVETGMRGERTGKEHGSIPGPTCQHYTHAAAEASNDRGWSLDL